MEKKFVNLERFPLLYLQWVYVSINSLNSDSQQFRKYQQNEQQFLTSNHWTQKKTKTYGFGNPDVVILTD